MKNHWLARLALLLALSAALNLTVSVAAEVGSAEDPLVTLSYLNDVFMNTVLQRVDQRAGGQAEFHVVTLSQDQTLTGDIGCEVMLRVGSGVCVSPSAPGLIDETGGQTLAPNAALVQNHLYMMTVEGRGVRATAPTTKLLVRGVYTVA